MREWLRAHRKKTGYTQEETAKLAGISRSYYTHIEKGNKTPTVKVAKEIAKALNFNWTLLFEDDHTHFQ